jgi:hypothetical protein
MNMIIHVHVVNQINKTNKQVHFDHPELPPTSKLAERREKLPGRLLLSHHQPTVTQLSDAEIRHEIELNNIERAKLEKQLASVRDCIFPRNVFK